MNSRVRVLNPAAVRADRSYVLYWAQVNRRVETNHALLHAAEIANRLELPVLYFEELDCTEPFASDRFHRFVLDGARDTARRLRELGIGYAFHVRRGPSELESVAASAAAVVTDDHPAASRPPLDVAFYAVDSSCIVPMSEIPTRQYAAYTIRPRIHKLLARYLKRPEPLRVRRRYGAPAVMPEIDIASCPIDHTVPPVGGIRGGADAAHAHLQSFLEHTLRGYAGGRNKPTARTTSGLSPWLHFGHISSLEVALAVREYASEHKLIADEFLEELIVRRELAFNFARHTPDVKSLCALPEWARDTMAAHARDARPALYTRGQFDRAETHDPLWNAAQKELRISGRIHGYYRMYWGKKIIEWSPTYEDALATMIFLNDRYALDGRDPNTCANILWCFGLHDRPWFERPVFGTIRTMTLEGMRRKTDVQGYIAEIEALS